METSLASRSTRFSEAFLRSVDRGVFTLALCLAWLPSLFLAVDVAAEPTRRPCLALLGEGVR